LLKKWQRAIRLAIQSDSGVNSTEFDAVQAGGIEEPMASGAAEADQSARGCPSIASHDAIHLQKKMRQIGRSCHLAAQARISPSALIIRWYLWPRTKSIQRKDTKKEKKKPVKLFSIFN